MDFTNPHLSVIIPFSILLYLAGCVLYRLYFSPLAKFPGPKIAALTGWYELYYDGVWNGKYIFEVEKMHRKYGPIVRINPYELSIDDPDFYNELYVTSTVRRTNGYEGFLNGMGMDDCLIATVGHDLHRQRRKPMESYFSRLGISRQEPMVVEYLRTVCDRINTFRGTSTVLRLEQIFTAFSGDVVSGLCSDEPTNLVKDPEFSPSWYRFWQTLNRTIYVFTQFPFLYRLIDICPKSLLVWLSPKYQAMITFEDLSRKEIAKAFDEKVKDSITDRLAAGTRTSLFRHIVNSDMPPSEMHQDRLMQEAQLLIAGGVISTARNLEFVSYYILANNHIRFRLQEELREPMAGYPENLPTWIQLEQLPYLNAVVKEGLRLSYAVSLHRLPRVSPDVALTFRDWTIPRGVAVGMSTYFMHKDPNVYVDPGCFKPERWLGDIDPRMNRNFVPFSRGSRNCLGLNLALAEIYLCLAFLFRPGAPELKLFETDESDVTPIHDLLVPSAKLDSKGVRVTVV